MQKKLQEDGGEDAVGYGSFDIILRPFFPRAFLSSTPTPARAVSRVLLGAQAYLMPTGACDPVVCPIRGFRISAASFAFEDFRWAVATVITRQNRIPISVDGTMTSTSFGAGVSARFFALPHPTRDV